MNQTTSLLPPPAPILQRAVAWILDAIVLGIALPIVALIIGDRGFAHLGTLLLALLLTASYYIGFLIALSATPGKLAMRLWVCDRNGRRVRPGQAVVRQLVLSASNLSILGFVFFLDLLARDVRQRRPDAGGPAPPPRPARPHRRHLRGARPPAASPRHASA